MQPNNGQGGNLQEVRALVRMLDERLGALEATGVSAGAPQGGTAEQRLGHVADFASSVLGSVEVDVVLERALQGLLRLAPADRAYLLLRTSDKTVLERYAGAQAQDGNAWASQKLARLAADDVVAQGQPVVLVDVASHPAYGEEAAAYDLDMRAMVAVPLRDGQQALGALYLDRRRSRGPFLPGDLKVIQALAAIVGRAVLSARMIEETNARRAHLEMLNRLYRTISRTLELDQLVAQIAQITIEVTQAERAFVLLMQNGQPRVVTAWDKEGPLSPQVGRELSQSVVSKVLQTGQGVYVFDTASDQEFGAKLSVVNLQLNSVVAVPLAGQAGLNGLLYIDSRTKSLTALEKEMAVLTAIANVTSMALDNAKLFRQATLDGMTGLYVRSFFNSRMDEEAARSQRYGRPFSLLVMDIDHFKKFNDTYGHQTGDEVIKLVANILKAELRRGVDLPGRYGGEELVAMLPETDAEGALVVAERIRKRIAATVLNGPNQTRLNVTVSIGVATFPAMGRTTAELFGHADEALYKSKQGGRNRTTLYDRTEVEAAT